MIAAPEWLVTGGGTIITGALGGFVATFLWEVVLKPRRERKALAELLAAELEQHARLLTAMRLERAKQPDRVVTQQGLSTGVYEAVLGRLGELPYTLVGPLVVYYQLLQRLRDVGAKVDAIGPVIVPPFGPAERKRELLEEYTDLAGEAEQMAHMIYTRLRRVTHPRWLPQRFRPPQSVLVTRGELLEKGDSLRTLTAAAVRRLDGR